MSKKQTAVSWLFEQLWKTPQYETEWQKLLEQAKQIEKEQIVDAIKECRKYPYIKRGEICYEITAEQFYSETYE